MQKKKQSIQKRSFILFELLVALGLVTLCFLPLIAPQIQMYRFEKIQLTKMQLEIGAGQALVQLKRKLLEQGHSWDDLMGKVQGRLAPIRLFEKDYTFNYTCKRIDRYPKKGMIKCAIIEVTLEREPKAKEKFVYTLCVERTS